VDSLEQLREDLWIRWRGAFDRIGELRTLKVARDDGKLYSNSARFNLSDFRPDSFPAGGRVLKEQPREANFYYVYRLDESGRPVHMSARHEFNRIDWEGIYLYSNTEAEYIEFCLQTKVVNDYARIAFQNALPVTLQHFKVNGGGSHLAGHNGKKAIDFVASSPSNYYIAVEEYDSVTGRINSGRALSEGLGTPLTRSVLEYSYSESGKLLQVTRTQDTGWKTTDYAAQTATSISDLADRLSDKIAANVIESLKKIDFASPLLSVELFYRQVTNYVPHIIAVTERDFLANPGPVATLDQKHWIDLTDQDFEPEMTEFTERLNADEEWDPGTSMLRKAALLVQQQLPHVLPAADCFVAFPIDWEFEGQDLHAILKECGATSEALTKLKTIGWLEE
jgi:hypothetical protein